MAPLVSNAAEKSRRQRQDIVSVSRWHKCEMIMNIQQSCFSGVMFTIGWLVRIEKVVRRQLTKLVVCQWSSILIKYLTYKHAVIQRTKFFCVYSRTVSEGSFTASGAGVTGCTIPRHRLYPGLNRARLDYTPGILCPRPVHTPGYELA